MQYRLFPPFFKDELNSDFSEAWERFCLKLLKIENDTEMIKKRKPPEQGVDLFYKDKKIAYQCKSFQKDANFNITKAQSSLLMALEYKESIGWDSYYICSNVELTGKQEMQLKTNYKGVEILDFEYWINLCKKYPHIVQENFRFLVDVPNRFISYRIKQIESISEDLKLSIDKSINSFCAWVYMHQTDEIFKVPLSKSMTIKDLKLYLRGIFGLSNAPVIDTVEIKVEIGITITEIRSNKGNLFDFEDSTILGEIANLEESLIELYIKYEFAGKEDIVFQFDSLQDFEHSLFNWTKKKSKALSENISRFNERGY